MNKSILITGVAGSGKTTLSDKLNKLGYKSFDIENINGLFAMFNKRTGEAVKDWTNNDLESTKQHKWICDKNKLEKIIKDNSQGITFYCGIGSNLEELIPLFNQILLLKVSPDVLRERLSKRTHNSFGRTVEVQDWIFSWKDKWENDMKEKGAIIINADQDLEKIAADIIDKVK